MKRLKTHIMIDTNYYSNILKEKIKYNKDIKNASIRCNILKKSKKLDK